MLSSMTHDCLKTKKDLESKVQECLVRNKKLKKYNKELQQYLLLEKTKNKTVQGRIDRTVTSNKILTHENKVLVKLNIDFNNFTLVKRIG